MAITNGNYVTSPIANTTMLEKLRDGVLYQYVLKAVDGYVLHDNRRDWTEEDPDTGEIIATYLGFTRGTASCLATYDFTANPREFYALPESEVPDNQIFGGVTPNPDHEVM